VLVSTRYLAAPMLLENVAELTPQVANGARTVVIGSGAVGLYVAGELAKRGHTAVVIESGRGILDSFAPETYVSVGRQHDGIRLGRSRSLGGTSNLWGGQLAEFQPIDFEGREWLPGSRWPVSYDEVAEYYRRTYSSLGIADEAQHDDWVWSKLGIDPPPLGEGLELFLTRWLQTPSFAVSRAEQIASSNELLVLTDHVAVGFCADGARITAVRVVDGAGGIHVVEADAFVVAAGTIETVRLLLHAASSRDWDCPWRENELLGTRFQDHLGGRIARVHPENRRSFFKTFANIVWSGCKYEPKIRLMDDTLGSAKVLNVHGMFKYESSVAENLAHLKEIARAVLYRRKISGSRDLAGHLRASWKYLVPIMWSYAREHRVYEPRTSAITLAMQGEQIVVPESRITIHESARDANGLPRVVLDWRVAGDELASFREFADRADRALRGAGLARLEIDAELAKGNPLFLSKLRDTYHQAGGAVMGTTETEGVVNPDLRVFGTNNLFVGGAATFRTASAANTTFTALAFGTRLVDHLTTGHATS
jgi:choline dehydrogenase-like flavoprotein